MHKASDYILGLGPGLLAALTLFRAYAVVRASIWAWKFGGPYLALVAKLPPPLQIDARHHLAIRRQMGGYSDFIISSYELWRRAHSREISEHPFRTLPLKALRRFWQLLIFIPAMAVLTLALMERPQSQSTTLQQIFSIIGLAHCLSLSLLVLALSAQAFAYVTVFRGAGGLHTGVPARYENSDKYGGGNLLLFVSSVGLSWIGVVGMSIFTNARFGGFGLVHPPAATFGDILSQIGQFTYYSLATATGVSDAQPTSPQAKLATGSTIVIGMSYFLALFGSILGTIQPSKNGKTLLVRDGGTTNAGTDDDRQLPLW